MKIIPSSDTEARQQLNSDFEAEYPLEYRDKHRDFLKHYQYLEEYQGAYLYILEKYLGALGAKTVLDVGCGTGGFLVACSRLKAIPVGVDIHRKSLRRAALRGLANNVYTILMQGDARNLPFSDDSFDCAIQLGLLEHIMNKKARGEAMKECMRVLKPGGYLLLAAHPNKFFPYDMHYGLPFINWLPKKFRYYYARLFVPDRIRNVEVTSNVSIREILGYIKGKYQCAESIWPLILQYSLRNEKDSPGIDACLSQMKRISCRLKLDSLLVLMAKFMSLISADLAIYLIIRK